MGNFFEDYLAPMTIGYLSGGTLGALGAGLSSREGIKEEQRLQDIANQRDAETSRLANQQAAELSASQRERGVYSSTYGADQERRLRERFLNDPTSMELRLQASRARGSTGSLLGQMLGQQFNQSLLKNTLNLTGKDPMNAIDQRLRGLGNIFGIGNRKRTGTADMSNVNTIGNDIVGRSTGIPSGFSNTLLRG